MFPRHLQFSAQGGLADLFTWRSAGVSGQIDLLNPGTITAAKNGSHIVERADVFEEGVEMEFF
jgi:hypothetical protein